MKARFKAGQNVTGRILDNDLAAKRISMTLKKSLISSKLPALTTLQVLALVCQWFMQSRVCLLAGSTEQR